jgi:integrase
MGKAAKSATDAELKKLVREFPAGRSLQKRGCGDGLAFLIERTSEAHTSARWVFEYRFAGKRKSLGLGTYPDVSLSRARELAGGQKAMLREGKDPAAERKADKQAAAVAHLTTLNLVADAWLDSERNRPEGAKKLSADTMDKLTWLASLARPTLGTLQIRDIATPDVVRAIEPIAKSGRVDTAHRVRELLSRIFAYAAVRGMCNGDPAAPLKKERSVLPAKHVVSHAAITDPKAFGEMLRAIEGYDSGAGNRARRTTTLALKLIALTALRPYELRHLRWSWVNIDNERIELPAEFIKMRKPHTVYLSRQAVEVLTELRGINARTCFSGGACEALGSQGGRAGQAPCRAAHQRKHAERGPAAPGLR